VQDVDGAVISTAEELFAARHFPSVVAICSDALEGEPECVDLLVLRARAHIALRRDLEAQADLRDIIRLDPQCGLAYRLLGELAARRDENESASIFFREALRLDPDDHAARDWLQIVEASLRPAAAAKKLPAPAAAAGRVPHARFARGTRSPENDERPTKPFARGSERHVHAAQPTASVIPPTPLPLPPPPNLAGKEPAPIVTITGRPAPQAPAAPSKIPSRPIARSPIPELPGFGEYLVTSGILTRERLRAAQAYQRSMKVQLSTAIVTLGLATPQRIEWASVAHQSHVARERQQL